jgi:choline dehydrogenase-like flavoprotein
MISDMRTFENGSQFEADVCLVGAGAAGITLALDLVRSNISVVLLESGGLKPEKPDQELNAGEVAGLLYKGLTLGRARAFGGTTKLWFGQCIRFDPIDFEKRPWVPHSGWPIGVADLDEWYNKAELMFGLPGQSYDEQIYKKVGTPAPTWNRDNIRTHFTIYSPKLDMGSLHVDQFRNSDRVRVLLHANATEIETDANCRETRAVLVRTISGKQARVRANAIVLCGGGIENARLLLLSNRVNQRGLGNDKDLVGRFLQDHPNGFTATLRMTDLRLLNDLFALRYRGVLRYFPKFPLGLTAQRNNRVLNCTCHLVFEHPEQSGIASIREIYRALRRRTLPTRFLIHLRQSLMHLPEVAKAGARRYLSGKSPLGKPRRVRLQCHTEQQPDPNSRITLSSSRDALGLSRPQVDWRIHESERHTMRVMTSAMGSELKRLGLAQLEMESWLNEPGNDWKSNLTDCFHHIGTTRMSDSPRAGVVDSNCEVFGVRNLYIAGSSTFPTSGYANPTLTIVAMSMRLAEHLKVEFRSSS